MLYLLERKTKVMYDQTTAMVIRAKSYKDATNELAIRTLKITDAIHDLTRLLKVVRSRCTHHDQTGIKMTYPTGGGFAQCRVCNHEIG